jgi:hypothetical protein
VATVAAGDVSLPITPVTVSFPEPPLILSGTSVPVIVSPEPKPLIVLAGFGHRAPSCQDRWFRSRRRESASHRR